MTGHPCWVAELGPQQVRYSVRAWAVNTEPSLVALWEGLQAQPLLPRGDNKEEP